MWARHGVTLRKHPIPDLREWGGAATGCAGAVSGVCAASVYNQARTGAG